MESAEQPLQVEESQRSWRADLLSWWPWLLLGLGLRLLLLPISGHADLLSLYDRVRLWDEGVFTLSDYSSQALSMLVHRFFAELWSTPLPDFSGVSWPVPTEPDVLRETLRLYSGQGAGAALALMKLPYVLFDLAAAVLLTRLVDRRHSTAIFALWMLQPFAIFLCSIFGKQESIMIVPLLAGMLALRRGKLEFGFLLVGLAIALRLYPVFLLPPLALAASPMLRRRAELFALGCLPVLWEVAAASLHSPLAWPALALGLWAAWRCYCLLRERGLAWVVPAVGLALLAVALPWIHAQLFNARFSLENVIHSAANLSGLSSGTDNGQSPDALLFAYGAVLVVAHLCARGDESRAPGRAELGQRLYDVALLSALAFFACFYFMPQYALLLVALATPRMLQSRDGLIAGALMLVGLLLFLLAFDGGNLSTRLFQPLAPGSLVQAPRLEELLGPGLADQPIGRLGLPLVRLACAWLALERLLALLAQAGFRRPAQALGSTQVTRGGWIAWCSAAALWPLLAAAYPLLLWHSPTRVSVPMQEEEGFQIESDEFGAVDFWTPGQVPDLLRARKEHALGLETRFAELQLDQLDLGGSVQQTRLLRLPAAGVLESGIWNSSELNLTRLELEPQHRYRVSFHESVEQPASSTRFTLLEQISGRLVVERVFDGWRASLWAPARWSAGAVLRPAPALGAAQEQLTGGAPLGWIWTLFAFCCCALGLAWLWLGTGKSALRA